VIVSDCVAVRDAASVTRTVKLGLPAAVGVPLITPDALRVSPAGKDPEASVQAYGVAPPAAESCWL
jgi:hypothetical protein